MGEGQVGPLRAGPDGAEPERSYTRRVVGSLEQPETTSMDRIVCAVQALEAALMRAGMLPTAILLRSGDLTTLQNLIRGGSPYLLFEDTESAGVQVWGVPFREEGVTDGQG